MREWVKEGLQWGSVGRDRFLSQQYVLILANCGARVVELRSLQWTELSTQGEGDNKRLVAFVKGKTGEREFCFQQGAEEYIKRPYDFPKDELEMHPPTDEFVFCSSKGEVIKSFRKGLSSLLKFSNLNNDPKVTNEVFTVCDTSMPLRD